MHYSKKNRKDLYERKYLVKFDKKKSYKFSKMTAKATLIIKITRKTERQVKDNMFLSKL